MSETNSLSRLFTAVNNNKDFVKSSYTTLINCKKISEAVISDINGKKRSTPPGSTPPGSTPDSIKSEIKQEKKRQYMPKYNIIEYGKELIIYVEIPGINEELGDIEILGNKLTISGNKIKPDNIIKELLNIDNKGVYLIEQCDYGDFKITFDLPFSITKKEQIQHHIYNSLLVIKISKTQDNKKIKIKYTKKV